MAMGTTRDDGSQQAMWVATADLPQGGGHPFYERLNQILNAAGFDAFVEQLCAPFYARIGRPSLAPRALCPAAAGGVSRRPRLGAGDCVTCGRFVESAVVPASGAAVGAARPVDDLADAAAVEISRPVGPSVTPPAALHATLVADAFLAPRPEHPLHFVSVRTYASGC